MKFLKLTLKIIVICRNITKLCNNQSPPFSKAQLLPKEERLEVSNQNEKLCIGLPKETSFQEKRICLTPEAVSALTSNGHRILIESGAGENAAFDDREYSEAGAEITKRYNKSFCLSYDFESRTPYS